MFTVYNCLVAEHDLGLVALAAAVCALASFTALSLVRHMRRSQGAPQQVWLYVAAISSGFGIWATHFIGMLAFSPHLPSGYSLPLTALSLLVAIVSTGLGICLALLVRAGLALWLGGAVVGAGIAAMHFTGMAAYEIPGTLRWDPSLVTASIVIGVVFGALSMRIGLGQGRALPKAAGTLLLTCAICGMHFTAMGAVAIMPDPALPLPASALPSGWLAAAVAVASLAIVVLAFAAIGLDLRERRSMAQEVERMRSLANAAVEGLVVCDGEVIVSVNHSFEALSGFTSEEIVGTSLHACLPSGSARAHLWKSPGEPVEAEIRHRDGSAVPVELIMHRADYAGKPHNVVAVRDLQDRKRAEARIHFLAHHDPLTGLANRASFDHRLDLEIETHRRNRQQFAVLCLDLDRFKEVNDLFGHAAGDTLLRTAADRLSAVLGEDQMLARLGGDEFAVIAPAIENPAEAGRVAEALLDALKSEQEEGPFALVSVSIGIALYPGDATNRAALLSNADTALYRAKLEGRSTYRFFEASMGEQVRERRIMENDLRHAITRGEMFLVYQPQTEIGTGEIVGFEALVRWQHPMKGEVSPGQFIPVAEESGAILKIGEWVMRTACREAAAWLHPLKIAINVSAVQLNNPNFGTLVEAVLQDTGLDPKRLELEITETALIRDPARALHALEQLKSLGICIAMDDFGTGYSSLSSLRNFPFDRIKIDSSFIRSIDVNRQAATIVKAVLGLGRGLGLPVLAEGVETAAELKFLDAQGCQEVQGYFFGRPAPIETFHAIVHGEAVRAEIALSA